MAGSRAQQVAAELEARILADHAEPGSRLGLGTELISHEVPKSLAVHVQPVAVGELLVISVGTAERDDHALACPDQLITDPHVLDGDAAQGQGARWSGGGGVPRLNLQSALGPGLAQCGQLVGVFRRVRLSQPTGNRPLTVSQQTSPRRTDRKPRPAAGPGSGSLLALPT
jgi:hypothetical protein